MEGTGEGRGWLEEEGLGGLRVGEWGVGSVGRPFGRWDKKKKRILVYRRCVYFEIYTIYSSILILI